MEHTVVVLIVIVAAVVCQDINDTIVKNDHNIHLELCFPHTNHILF
jgi:hypothetical protein